ncbi:MAG: hypothetical protein H8E61_00195 [Bacteroidetes bacterium]|nr:hypothetical protein [Bacteroidota bacterium]
MHFPENEILLGKRGDTFPEDAGWWKGDYIISYLSPWIIPEYLLNRAQVASINFHSGPPEYPGIGCTNFAIYNQESIYGVTCHYMAAKVDTGEIIAVKRFPLLKTDTVFSLTQKGYSYILTLFYEVASQIYFEHTLPSCGETWKRKPYKRTELNKLCKINQDMDAEEIKRRIKATSFPNAPGAYIEIEGMRFPYEQNKS